MSTPTLATVREEGLAINALRVLALDQIQAAGSGHPGLPLGAAPIMYTVFARHLRVDPASPRWVNRDRFVLSAGHGSALLYAALHLSGFDLTTEDLRSFRQWGSRTPGHPEVGVVSGVDATTGPLGQGVANAVGMAIAEAMANARLRDESSNAPLIDHRTFALVSDGDLMEGVALEALALAGRLGLGKLVLFYDDNDIVIDGRASEVHDADAVCGALSAYGWHVSPPVDGENVDAIDEATVRALAEVDRPSLVRVRTTIGRGSHLEDTPAIHSGAVSEEEADYIRKNLGWPLAEPFLIPDGVRHAWAVVGQRGAEAHARWRSAVEAAVRRGSSAAERLERWQRPIVADDVAEALSAVQPVVAEESVRVSSGRLLGALCERFDNIVGGSADLVAATMTSVPDGGQFGRSDRGGRNIAYGLREHAMGAISNGIALHGLFRPFASTFMAFATYEANAMRMAALQHLPVIHVLTHDSVSVGEDGPTHQPVEVLAALRATPNMSVLRPADAYEARFAWQGALSRAEGPTVLALSRGPVPQLDRARAFGGPGRGGYILNVEETPEVNLVASGTEVALAVEAARRLASTGVTAQVVSMPSLDVFAGQPGDYQDEVLSPTIPRLFVEASHPMSWWRLIRGGDAVAGVTRFGASAPGARVMREYGFDPDRIAAIARGLVAEPMAAPRG